MRKEKPKLTRFVGIDPLEAARFEVEQMECRFVAVQAVDVLWAVFILGGVEHARIVPGFTESNALDLYDMPYTHSLIATFVWALLAGGADLEPEHLLPPLLGLHSPHGHSRPARDSP